MNSVIDILNAEKLPWAALPSEEVMFALQTCTACAKGPKQAFAHFAAYMAIASKRRNDTGRASLASAEAAKHVPTFRGEMKLGMSDSYFDRTIRQNLRKWGLVEYAEGKAKKATAYGFPFIEYLSQGAEAPEASEQNAGDMFEQETEQNAGFSSEPFEQNTGDMFEPVRTKPVQFVQHQEVRGKSTGIEKGYNYSPESPSPSEPQPSGPTVDYCVNCCARQEITELISYAGNEPMKMHRCKACGSEWPAYE